MGSTLEVLDSIEDILEIVVAPCSRSVGIPRGTASPVTRARVRVLDSFPDRLSAIRAALRTAPPSDRLLVHDLEGHQSPSSISAAIAASSEAVVASLAVKSTFKRVSNGVVHATVSREQLISLQGPWVFGRVPLEAALARAVTEKWLCKDEIMLARRAGMQIKAVASDPAASQAHLAEELSASLGPWEPAFSPI